MASTFTKSCVTVLTYCLVTSLSAGLGFNSPPETKGDGTICGNIDIRNKVDNFARLENCTVIEGSLSILLIEEHDERQYEQLHFPNLVEITDYFLLYRVYKLKTLSNIFPNLSVIRGQRLFFNFAFVVFEMMDLEEIGLTGLTVIERGAVRFEKNPMLCYIDTIDWTRITSVDPKDHFIKGNKISSECVDICPKHCVSTPKSNFDSHRLIQRCWTYKHCQKNLDCPCGKDIYCKGNTKECCHENCLGGCSGDRNSDCDACKKVIFKDPNGNPQCHTSCIGGTYKYKGRRCLLEDECLKYTKYHLLKDPTQGPDHPGECVAACPAGYTKDSLDPRRCIKCKDTCPKECAGKKVDSVQAAQDLSGCTKIQGALEIRINKGINIQQELEKNLGQITEIEDYLWVHNSDVLLSLNFLKSLKIIGGKKLVNGYSVLVNDNEKLQTLFPSEVKKLIVQDGSLNFHFNRKLCLHVIKAFEKNATMLGTNVQNDISNTTNGDQAPCHVSTLNLTVFQVTGHVAFLKWDRHSIGDSRALISYVIKYKEAPFQNVSIFEGRDACSDDIWKTRDVLDKRSPAKNNSTFTALLVQLRPWTQYAVFVHTYMTSNTQFGAMSKLKYFRTAASMPTVPANLKTKPERPGELLVTWDPPNQPNGNVTHYEVYWRRRELDPRTFAPRDYCHNPLIPYESQKEQNEREEMEEKKKKDELNERCCECETSKEDLELMARERNLQIQFENFLHNSVYLKSSKGKGKPKQRSKAVPDRKQRNQSKKLNNKTRKRNKKRFKRNIYKEVVDPREFEKYKREAPDVLVYNSSETVGQINITDMDTDTEEPDPPIEKKPPIILRAVVYAREFIISNLGHFEDYNVEVIACQERDKRDPDKVKYCSSRALTVGRTLKSPTADNIDDTKITAEEQHNKTGSVIIKWRDPPNPNGPIIKYMIEFNKGSLSENPNSICQTYQEYRKLNGTIIPILPPGNYSFRIQAHSLAGNGSWSKVKWFFIKEKTETAWATSTIIAVTIPIIILCIVLTVIVVWFIARSKITKIPDNFLSVTVNPDYMPDMDAYVPDEWEVDRDKICLIRELGQGSFGMVWEGKAKDLLEKGKDILVAVKTVNENADYYQKVAFLKEASIMKGFKCHHVVQLLGIVSQSQPALVVMELMTHGDLKNYLRMRRPDNEEGMSPPTLEQIWQMAGEIADGMAYLSDHKFVHRDLAARNCMVAGDLTVKIGDFGMTRDVYETDYYRKGGKGLLPVRWMGPESLKDGVFTSYSDVWSYGVVLWEMVTLAELPYIGLSHEQVIKYVISGRVIEKPDGCPDRLYQLMLQCWRYKDKQRPTFQQIIEILVPHLSPEFREKSYFFSEENRNDDNFDDYPDDFPDDEDFLDESNKPFIMGDSSQPSSHHSHSHQSSHGSHGFGDQDEEDIKFLDLDNLHHLGTEPCDCIMLEETDHRNHVDSSYRNSSCSNPNSAIETSDGSKDSSTSKSSNSSYPINGINLNIVNGHVPVHMRTTPC